MSEERQTGFDGFMPMISQVTISEADTMISTDGDLVKAHTVSITTKNGDSYIFSMDPVDLMRLSFLLLKIASQSIE